MEARDVMVSPVITLEENEAVRTVAELLIARRTGAVPIVDSTGRLLMRRAETRYC
jgi:CBS domain-containing protein